MPRIPAEKSTFRWISPWTEAAPLMATPQGKAAEFLGPVTFQPSKFVLLELLAALTVAGLFIWLARKIQSGQAPRGRLWNLLEAIVVYVRDEMAKPAIGSHDYKRFLPLIWTLFFFILAMNLMGMFPLLGTPTGNINVTAALALSVFAIVLVTGMKKAGRGGFLESPGTAYGFAGSDENPDDHRNLVHRGLRAVYQAHGVGGSIVRQHVCRTHGAGRASSVLSEPFGAWPSDWLVIPGSIGASVAIGVLEVLVAFIQAYVFTFLTALFIGAAIHPH